MEKIKAHFSKWPPRRFVLVTVVSLLVTDILNSYYLKLFWLKRDLSTLMVHQMIRKQGMILENFSIATINEMKGFIDNAFYFFLFLIFVNNLFFYFFYFRKKLWAQGYVLFYTLTAAIFALSFLIDQSGLGWIWFVYNLLTIPFYAYLYFGVKVLKNETTITPGHEKKAL